MLSKKNNRIPIHAVLIIIGLVVIFPFIWMIVSSFKTDSEIITVPPTFFPEKWSLEAYIKSLDLLPFKYLYLNTLLMVMFRVICALAFSSLAGFVFARYNFPFKNILFTFVIVQLMVPAQIFLIPQYFMVSKLGITNTIGALVFPGLVSAFGTFYMRQVFMGLPKSLDEAAELDGCNPFQIYWFILLPLVKHGLAALAIFTALFAWKDLMWPLIVNQSLTQQTVAGALSVLLGLNQYGQQYSMFMATATLGSIPPIILFVIFQKQITASIASTGTKG